MSIRVDSNHWRGSLAELIKTFQNDLSVTLILYPHLLHSGAVGGGEGTGNGWVSQSVSEWVGEWVGGWVGEWVSEWVSEREREIYQQLFIADILQISSLFNSKLNHHFIVGINLHSLHPQLHIHQCILLERLSGECAYRQTLRHAKTKTTAYILVYKGLKINYRDAGLTCTCLMRDEEGRKKEASKVKQTRQSNTAHPRQSLFLRKMSCLGLDSNPRHSTL